MGPGFEDRFTPSGEGGRGGGGLSDSGMRDAAATPRSATPGRPRGVGERVRALRVAAGLTQTELAGERFSKEYVSQIERGKTRPTADTVAWLAALSSHFTAGLCSGIRITPASGPTKVQNNRPSEAQPDG